MPPSEVSYSDTFVEFSVFLSVFPLSLAQAAIHSEDVVFAELASRRGLKVVVLGPPGVGKSTVRLFLS